MLIRLLSLLTPYGKSMVWWARLPNSKAFSGLFPPTRALSPSSRSDFSDILASCGVLCLHLKLAA